MPSYARGVEVSMATSSSFGMAPIEPLIPLTAHQNNIHHWHCGPEMVSNAMVSEQRRRMRIHHAIDGVYYRAYKFGDPRLNFLRVHR